MKVQYWKELADYDLETARAMLETQRYLYVGFMCHQATEKIIKAYYASIYDQQPPRTHNLRMLAQKANILSELDDEQNKLLNTLEPLNVEARYPTDKERLLQSLNYNRCHSMYKSTQEFIGWIKNKL